MMPLRFRLNRNMVLSWYREAQLARSTINPETTKAALSHLILDFETILKEDEEANRREDEIYKHFEKNQNNPPIVTKSAGNAPGTTPTTKFQRWLAGWK